MVNITRLAKKELRFIIREFIELERMLKLAKKGESAVPQECQRLLKLLQKGLRTEERIEYYSARQFFKLRKAIVRAGSGLTIQEGQKITELLRQAVIYDGFLKKLSSRGGEIEEKLSSLVKNPTLREMKELQQVLEEAISADRSFELLIQEIIKTMEGVKTTKSALLLEEMHPRLALLQSGSALILFDLEKVKDIFRMDARAKARAFGEEGRALVRKGQSAFAKRHLAERQAYHLEITAEQPVDGTGGMFDMPKLLTNEQDKIFKTAILGYCEFRNGYSNSDIFCGAMMTYRTAAKRGYGVLLYELAFSFASLNHRAVIGDRSEISTPARKIWEYFDLKRRDVLKYPAMLAKYPELIGYSKESAVEKFGEKGVFYSSTFNRYGFPVNIPEEKMNKLFPQHFRGYLGDTQRDIREGKKNFQFSYQERKSGSSKEVVGGLASLDKAYYYDGKKGLLQVLLARWTTAGELSGLPGYGATARRCSYDVYAAGYAFFQSFKGKQ